MVSPDYPCVNQMQRRYYYGPGIDEPIRISVSGSGSGIYFYHFDGLGSVVALTKSDGDVVERYSCDVFGEPNRTSTVGNPYMFTGRNYDSETGLYYYRARYYSSTIGRFLQADPIGYEAGINIYTYCWNNPIMRRDLTGLTGKTDCQAQCKSKFDSEWATAGWLYDVATAGCNAILDTCLAGCNKIPGCGKLGEVSRKSCAFLCAYAHGPCMTAAYGLYMEALAGASINYGICMGACSALY